MQDKIESLLETMNQLERELLIEIQKKEHEFLYEIRKKKVRFEREVKSQHRLLVKKLRDYFRDAAVMNIVTAPVIWSLLIPAVFMDLAISAYQAICFPIYGIPRVRRGDYVVLDRHYLSYLNFIEKMNCYYCGYFNGLMGYVREVAARTEQYWCPIKHARRIKSLHSRYKFFMDYGDGEKYRKSIEQVRRSFGDLEKGSDASG